MTSTLNNDEMEQPIDPNEFADEELTNYNAPARKSIKEIIAIDETDESLKRYKETLLGDGTSGMVIIDENNPSSVLMKKLSLVVNEEVVQSLELPASEEFTLTLKEGSIYKIRFDFFVQREIVSGLKYLHKVSRMGLPVTKESQMLGSFGPSRELYTCSTPAEEAPSGMLSRGKYRIRSLITDDDNNRYLEWTWQLEISKN